MISGFTLLEVVVAVVLLEIGVLASAGTFVVAARSLREAEHLERAVLEGEGLLDSLAGAGVAVDGSRPYPGGTVEWTVDASGIVELRVVSSAGEVLLEMSSGLVSP